MSWSRNWRSSRCRNNSKALRSPGMPERVTIQVPVKYYKLGPRVQEDEKKSYSARNQLAWIWKKASFTAFTIPFWGVRKSDPFTCWQSGSQCHSECLKNLKNSHFSFGDIPVSGYLFRISLKIYSEFHSKNIFYYIYYIYNLVKIPDTGWCTWPISSAFKKWSHISWSPRWWSFFDQVSHWPSGI